MCNKLRVLIITGDREFDSISRGGARAEIMCFTAIANLRDVHALGLWVSEESSLILEHLSAVIDLDTWWLQFKSEIQTNSILHHLGLPDRTGYVLGSIAAF